MDAAVAKLISLVPERTARVPNGTAFLPDASAGAHAERLAHLAARLRWLTPLESLSQEDRQRLGFPVHARPQGGDDDDGDLGFDSELPDGRHPAAF